MCIVESDESDASHSKICINHAIVTSIDHDHLEFYDGSFEKLRQSFIVTLERIITQHNGFIVANIDCKEVRSVVMDLRSKHPNYSKLITYSLNDTNTDFVCENFVTTQNSFSTNVDIVVRGTDRHNVALPMVGKCNISNMLGAIGMLSAFGGKIDNSLFSTFTGLDKRFSILLNNESLTVIDDYAHNPAKIQALISATLCCYDADNVFYAIEPHKYSRVSMLYDEYLSCYSGAKNIVMMDIFGVQGVGSDSFGVTKEALCSDIVANNTNINLANITNDNAIDHMLNLVENNKHKILIVFCGAGHSSSYANKFVDKLRNRPR